MRGVRLRPAPCFQAVSLLSKHQMAPVLSAKIGGMFNPGVYPTVYLGFVFYIPAIITTLVTGWNEWPAWAWWTLLVCFLINILLPELAADIPMGTTDLFLRTSSALVIACQELNVIVVKPPKQTAPSGVHTGNVNIDWHAT